MKTRTVRMRSGEAMSVSWAAQNNYRSWLRRAGGFAMQTRPLLALWSALWAPAVHIRLADVASEGELHEAEAPMGAWKAH